MMDYSAFLDNFQLSELGNPIGEVSKVLGEYHVDAFDYQFQKARKSIPFYIEHYKNSGIKRIESFNDIQNLPFVTSDMIRENGKSFLGVSQDEIKRVVTLSTSGTTGISKRIFFTDDDIERTINFFVTILSKLIKRDEKALILLPSETPSSAGDLLGIALIKISAKALLKGIVKDFNDTVLTIVKNKPSLIIGLPVQILILSELLKLRGEETDYIKNVIVTSDFASEVVKKRIADNLNCDLYDHYGMTETCYGAAIDCFANDGYHLRELDLYVEIIDPVTGENLKKGKTGEIVISTLTCKGMPLLRYRTGDISSINTDPCMCGSPFKRLNFIKNRFKNTISIGGKKIGIEDLDGIIFSEDSVVDYEAEFKKEDQRYCLSVVLRMIKGSSLVPENVEKRLKTAPIFKEAFQRGEIHLSSVKYESIVPENTYVSKRQLKLSKGVLL